MAGKITALEAQRRSKNRINIYLNGEFAFGLADIVAVKLKVGQCLSDDDIAALQCSDGVERARERVLDYLSYRPRSESEVRRYLLEKQFSEVIADELLSRLRGVGLVDDGEFARYWIENRTQFRPRGRRGLFHELRQKGIASNLIEAALADFDELDAARKVAESQGRRLTHLSPKLFRQRLTQRMARRGFSYEIIREVLAEYPFPKYTLDESEVD